MTRFLPALALACAFGSPGFAQKMPVKIDASTRVGLPPGPIRGEQDEMGRAAPVVKLNSWAPIYLKLLMGEKSFSNPAQADAYLHVDGQDGDGLGLGYRLALGSLFDRAPGTAVEPGEFPHMPYLRPSRRGNVTLTVRSADGTRLSDAFTVNISEADPATFVILSLGTKLSTLSLKPLGQTQDAMNRKGLRNGRVVPAACVDPMELPDHWFGYAAADVVVLPTGGTKLPVIDALFGDQALDPKFKVRRDALFEWVRRGGKLVVSTGSNADKLTQYPLLQEFLVASVTPADPKRQVAKFPLSRIQPSNLTPLLESKAAADRFAVANLRIAPDKGARVVMDSPEENRANVPVVVQWPYGTGKVTVVAFDLDRSPFADNPLKDELWDWLFRQAANPKAFLGDETRSGSSPAYPYDVVSREDKFAEALRTDGETFDGVPVISFGWVALFIILYTLLIGPVEYLFLKKVVKRLELTWITFPIIVITVSVVAYYTAYAIKGRDLRINKVDVVDVDPATGRVYGRTWVSVFSPRRDLYEVGVGPNKGWVADGDARIQPDPLVDWTAGGSGSADSLTGGRYAYRVDAPNHKFADGLIDVPIQTWSVKMVEANWSYLTVPLVESRLYHPPGTEQGLAGDFVSRLPFGRCTNPNEPDATRRTYALTDTVAVYGGKVYKLGTIVPNVPVKILALPGEEDPNWLTQNARVSAVATLTEKSGAADPNVFAGTGNVSLWGAMFHEFVAGRTGSPLANASLRSLDQSWRVDKDYLDEVMILAKLGPETGPTEAVFGRDFSPSPTLVWLRGRPGDGKTREPIPGSIRQETYVRIFLPVKKAPK